MGKVCKVKSCPSGRNVKNKENDISQPPSFFRPTTPDKLRDWEISLGIQLQITDYICHLHFKEEHIKMYDKFNIKGEVMILPTGKKTLRDNALPTIEHQFIPVLAHKLQACGIYQPQEPGSNHNQSKEKKQLSVQDNIEQQELLVDHQKLSNNLLGDIKQTEHDSEGPLLNELARDMYDLQNYQETEVNTQSVENFMDDFLKCSRVPQFWMFEKIPNGLEFMRMDRLTKQIINHVRVNEDYSTTVIFPNNEELTLNEPISSFNSIYDYLESVEKWPLCVGTQFDNNK